jgi:hypothetical protein
MTCAPRRAVSFADKQAFARQAAALSAEENWDEADPAQEASIVAWADRTRAAQGIAPLVEWWQTKTEPELHERARALGLLD